MKQRDQHVPARHQVAVAVAGLVAAGVVVALEVAIAVAQFHAAVGLGGDTAQQVAVAVSQIV